MKVLSDGQQLEKGIKSTWSGSTQECGRNDQHICGMTTKDLTALLPGGALKYIRLRQRFYWWAFYGPLGSYSQLLRLAEYFSAIHSPR